MTGREKVMAAFTTEGRPEIGVVSCYEGIFIRDHYNALTEIPWWNGAGADLARDFFRATGLEWFSVYACASREERARQRFEERTDGVYRIDNGTGRETRLSEPTPGGTNTSSATSKHMDPDSLPTTRKEIDALIPRKPGFDRDKFLAEGRNDSAVSIREAVDLMLYSQIASPLWSLYGLFGYEGMMVLLAQDPDLAAYAGQRIFDNVAGHIRLISALDADAVWIEECLTDQISPELFEKINVPLMRQCVQEIRASGMKSIYYYCGNPNDRLDAILGIGADAVHFEESKKGFTIDIADIVNIVNGRCTVFGNIDSIDTLQKGSESELRSEIGRQLDAGARNGNRFILSTGSPITPETPVERVRLYTDIARELGKDRFTRPDARV